MKKRTRVLAWANLVVGAAMVVGAVVIALKVDFQPPAWLFAKRAGVALLLELVPILWLASWWAVLRGEAFGWGGAIVLSVELVVAGLSLWPLLPWGLLCLVMLLIDLPSGWVKAEHSPAQVPGG